MKKSLAAAIVLCALVANSGNAVVVVTSGGASAAAHRRQEVEANAASMSAMNQAPATDVVVCKHPFGYKNYKMELRVATGCTYDETGWYQDGDGRQVTWQAYAEWLLNAKVDVVGLSYNDYSDRVTIYVRRK
ncbi:hypothetical protein ACVIHC_002214 [Bradyrhizobium diazoefficiens]